MLVILFFSFFFSSRRRHTRCLSDWSSDVCSSDLGYYRWVDRAFGRFWAFQNGWLTWMYSLVDMAIYPVLFNQYLRYFIPGLDARVEWLISLAIIWGAAWINVRGSLNVSRTSIIAGCFIMLGFLALSVASVLRVTHIPWQPFASENAHGFSGLAVGI